MEAVAETVLDRRLGPAGIEFGAQIIHHPVGIELNEIPGKDRALDQRRAQMPAQAVLHVGQGEIVLDGLKGPAVAGETWRGGAGLVQGRPPAGEAAVYQRAGANYTKTVLACPAAGF